MSVDLALGEESSPPAFIIPPGARLDPANTYALTFNGAMYSGSSLNNLKLPQIVHRLPSSGKGSDQVVRYSDGTTRNQTGKILLDPGPNFIEKGSISFPANTMRLANGAALPGNDVVTAFRLSTGFTAAQAISMMGARDKAGVGYWQIAGEGPSDRFASDKSGVVRPITYTEDDIAVFGVPGNQQPVDVTAPVDRTAVLDPKYVAIPPQTPQSREATSAVTPKMLYEIQPVTSGGGVIGVGSIEHPVLKTGAVDPPHAGITGEMGNTDAVVLLSHNSKSTGQLDTIAVRTGDKATEPKSIDPWKIIGWATIALFTLGIFFKPQKAS